MSGLRGRLLFGFGTLLAVVAGLGLLTVSQVDELGQSVDVILRENYRSVVACQDMKEALERIDSGVLYTLTGEADAGRRLISDNEARFREAMDVELGNLTLPGEREAAERLQSLYGRFEGAVAGMLEGTDSARGREAYFGLVQPLFEECKTVAQSILEMNQASMSVAKDAAAAQAASARRNLVLVLLLLVLAVLLLGWLVRRWILEPIRRLNESTHAIAGGNLDLVLEAGRRDELGQLAASFNGMAAAIRQARREDQRTVVRSRRATHEVLKALPAAVAVLDLGGRVDVTTDTAERVFGLGVGVKVEDLGFDWLAPLMRRALQEGAAVETSVADGYIQKFIDNRERFFQPQVVPIPAGPASQDITGLALIMKDVTRDHEQYELGRDAGLVVSHQLKTPLTSLRMSLHLLLDESIGSLNEGQTDLLLAARDDSERLVAIINDLIDLDRQGSAEGGPRAVPVEPGTLVAEALEHARLECRDRGLELVAQVDPALPAVLADAERIGHVLDNLLANAVRFTGPGGTITVGAEPADDHVAFSVSDSGEGIAADQLERVFEPFYRGPGQEAASGVGLGLTIAREIVRSHGGELSAASAPGRGATFTFTLPVAGGDGR
ncbi:MAG: HAMP domain-containing protein [bacterium]|nr:HAMP domain-containing protein [bacterium]MBK9777928.1 HAMP domain-containing protein [bacterium]